MLLLIRGLLRGGAVCTRVALVMMIVTILAIAAGVMVVVMVVGRGCLTALYARAGLAARGARLLVAVLATATLLV